jgi:hypothetical protein
MDIVERLRKHAPDTRGFAMLSSCPPDTLREAIDEITRLRAALANETDECAKVKASDTCIRAMMGLHGIHDTCASVQLLWARGRDEFERLRDLGVADGPATVREEIAVHFAQATAVEREECAKVAATYAGYGARADVCMAIATAIRSRKDKGE